MAEVGKRTIHNHSLSIASSEYSKIGGEFAVTPNPPFLKSRL
jgi:hypothetical protein